MKPNRELAVKILNKLIETNRLKKPGCEWDTTIGIVTFILDQNDARKDELDERDMRDRLDEDEIRIERMIDDNGQLYWHNEP